MIKLSEVVEKLKGIGGRILLSYLIVFVLFCSGMILTNNNLRAIEVNTRDLSNQYVPHINMASEIKAGVLAQQVYVREYIDRENPKVVKEKFRQQERLILDRLEKLMAISHKQEQSQQIVKVKQEYDEFLLMVNTIFKLDPGRSDLTQVLLDNYVISVTNINKLTDVLVKDGVEGISRSSNENYTMIRDTTLTNSLIITVAIAFGIGATYVLYIWISRPILSIMQSISGLAKGDLTQRVGANSIKEFAVLGQTFNEMVDTLRNLITHIAEASKEVSQSSEHLSESAKDVAVATRQVASGMDTVVDSGDGQVHTMGQAKTNLNEINQTIQLIAQRAQQQANSIDSASLGIKEIATMANAVNAKAKQLESISGEIAQIAEAGGERVDQAITGMDGIKGIVTKSSEVILGLVNHSAEIGKTVQLIGEIADQTNLLALNARIEAARAGEAGKGFAVIAEHVRQLADKSAEATKQVGSLVLTVQNGINESATAMEKIITETTQGGDLVSSAGQVLGQIINNIEGTIQPIQEISGLIHEVSGKTGDVVGIINSVADLAQDNAQASRAAVDTAMEVNSTFGEVSEGVVANVDIAKEIRGYAERISESTEGEAAAARQLAGTAVKLEDLISSFRINK